MILPIEYDWLLIYINNDNIWIEESLNWENILNLTFLEFSPCLYLITSFFYNNLLFINFFTKISFLDIILLIEIKINFSQQLYNLFLFDFINLIFVNNLFIQFFFYSDYQDFLIILLYYSPELLLILNEFLNSYFISNIFDYSSSIVFDFFTDHLNTQISEFIEYFVLFFYFIWIIIFMINIFRIFKWNNHLELYFIRIYNYLFSITKEISIQFELILQFFFFIIFYWIMLIAIFDDDKEELIEMLDVSYFFFFIYIIFYLIYKYSQHYFSFLEASIIEGKSVLFIFKQFFRDFINTFALLLRFIILLFRLNIYDTLDDFYDSYYIYIGDFDDDEYISELFFSYHSLLFYNLENNGDMSFSYKEENEFILDFFFIYFLCWTKFFTFIFFILEEILRISLASYICYLIIFEIHSVNCSYIEDIYFFNKKSQLIKF